MIGLPGFSAESSFGTASNSYRLPRARVAQGAVQSVISPQTLPHRPDVMLPGPGNPWPYADWTCYEVPGGYAYVCAASSSGPVCWREWQPPQTVCAAR